MVALGCRHQAAPPVEPPEPPCVPTLQSAIAQLKDVTEPVPAGVTEDAALEALAAYLSESGVTIDTTDRQRRTIGSKPFVGETIAWSCEMNEYREYAYRVAVTDHHWTVGLTCRRSFGWEAHLAGDKVVAADHGVVNECLDTAKYTTPLDAMRGRNVMAGARKVLRSQPQ